MNRLYVVKAENIGNLSVKLDFSDKFTSIVNVGDFIRKHPHLQYNKYLDEKKFKSFVIDDGNVVWGKNWDLIFPIEELHAGYLQ